MARLTILTIWPKWSKWPSKILITQKTEKIMAHYKASTGLDEFTGALSKRKVQGVNDMTVTRRKPIKDPLTGEVVVLGPKEIYIQGRRDLEEHPYTEKEKKNHGDWSQACRDALPILRDKSHPRYMELYYRWRAQLNDPEPYTQFQGFVRAVMMQEQ
jgi:hypothetical protein